MADDRPYTWSSSDYRSHGGFVADRARSLVDLLDPRPGERILDLGCGTGELTAAIAAAGATATGVDSSPDMIAAARKSFPRLRFDVADGHELKFDGEFDGVFSNAALHWMTRPGEVVSGIRRALKQGGRLAAEFGGHGNVAAVRRAIEAVLSEWGEPASQAPRWYFPTAEAYSRLLEEHGFRVRSADLFDRPTPMEGGDGGLHRWLRLFTASLLETLGGRAVEFVERVGDRCRSELFRDGVWVIDYVRLRVAAVKP